MIKSPDKELVSQYRETREIKKSTAETSPTNTNDNMIPLITIEGSLFYLSL